MRILFAAALLLSLAANGLLLYRRLATAADHPPLAFPRVAPPTVISFAENPAAAIAGAWKLTSNGDPKSFVARLRAASVPERIVRALVTAAIEEQFRPRENALRPPPPKLKFWQAGGMPLPFQSRLALLDLKREKARLCTEILGPDPAAEADRTYAQLPADKRELTKAIVEDYDAMLVDLRAQSEILRLPSEREQIAFLEAQRHHDLIELLTPDEVVDLERRNSPVAGRVRYDLRFFGATPAEFQAIFAAESVIIPIEATLNTGNDSSIALAPETAHEKAAEKARLLAELKTVLGDTRYAEYRRAQEQDFHNLSDLSLRAGLPSDTPVRAFDLRDRIASESQRIANDDALDLDEQRAALKSLAATSRAQLAALLGPDASIAFSKRSENLFFLLEHGEYAVFGEDGISTNSLGNRLSNGPH